MGLQVHAVRPMLRVHNLEETISYYTRILGFRLERRAAKWCALRWGAAEIFFYTLEAAAEPLNMTGMLCFEPEDVESLWDRLRHRVQVEWELQQTEYRTLEFAIRDCNGYVLTFREEAEPDAA
jgi:catechol 2,3-dioxygenase-like lactoylglutathione lyase family enzyme